MSAIRFDHVSKRFVLHRQRARSLQDLFVAKLSRKQRQEAESFWALRDVTFEVAPGEMIGVIGPNGAGKSTLLKLLARVIEPTHGRVAVNGRLNALIELSAGFHEELTGRENIYLNAALLGLSRKQIQRHFDEIIAFSELDKFIDMPVKHYSSGMHMRLGFAIATCIESDVLLVDEVLAVGDANFQRKCFERIAEIRERGTTILFVSHQMADVERHCDRVLLLMNGKLLADGVPAETTRHYQTLTRRRRSDTTDFYSVEYVSWDIPAEMRVGERAQMQVTLRNGSNEVWQGEQGSGTRIVSLSYHWLDRYANMHQFMGPRKMLPRDLLPGEEITLTSYVIPPAVPGPYILELDMAIEGKDWFAARGKPGPQLSVLVMPEQTIKPKGNGNVGELIKSRD